MKNNFLLPFSLGLILVVILLLPISFNLLSYTFNFADNAGYAVKLYNIHNSIDAGTPFVLSGEHSLYLNEETTIIPISILWEYGYLLVSGIIDPYLYINLAVLINLYLGFIFAYSFFYRLSGGVLVSLLGASIFALSSWALYAGVWLNLLGTFFVPLLFDRLHRHYSGDTSKKSYALIMIYIFGLAISSTYYIPFVGIILLGFFVAYRRHIIRFLLPTFLLIGLAFVLYQAPLYIIKAQGFQTGFEEYYEANKIVTSRDIVEEVIVPNQFNPLTKTLRDSSVKLIQDINPEFKINILRPVMHIPLFILILAVFYSIYLYRNATGDNRKLYFVLLSILLISFILFLGDKLKILGYDTGIYSLLYLIKQLPYGEILRKSHYFYFLLTFAIAGIIVLGMHRYADKKHNFVILALLIGFLAFSQGSFPRPYHIVSRFTLPCELIKHKNILQIPNTSYSDRLYTFHILNNGCSPKIINYKNGAIPAIKPFFHENYNDITSIIRGEEIETIESDILDYIIVYKKSIVHFFGFQVEGGYYKNAVSRLGFIDNVLLIEETPDYRLYKVIK